MSKLAELLAARGAMPVGANPANPANQSPKISRISNISRGAHEFNLLPPDLERRLKAMAARWNYSPEDYRDVMGRAKQDPVAWAQAVALDEEREAEFRDGGVLPKVNT